MTGLFTKLLINQIILSIVVNTDRLTIFPLTVIMSLNFFMDFSLLYPSLMSKMNIDFFERFMIFLHTFLISVLKKQFATNCFWITLYISILYFWDNNYFYMCYVLCCFSLTYLLSYVQALCLGATSHWREWRFALRGE